MFFEDTACVQFDHRMLAYASTIGTLGLSLRAVTLHGASPAVVNVARMLPVVVSLQAALGITTLLWYSIQRASPTTICRLTPSTAAASMQGLIVDSHRKV